MKLLKSGFVLGLLILVLLGGNASASQLKSITAKGISITPAIENLTLDNNPQASFTIQVDNHTNSPVTLTASSLDFKSLNETGGLAFISSGFEAKYGLANWLSLPSGPITLKPHTAKQISITVTNRSDLSPGGHYAAILFNNVGSSSSNSSKVNVNQVVASLVFLKKSGGEIFSLNLQKPDLGSSWLKIPSNLDLLISNGGNTQTAPRGAVTITNPLGHEIKHGIINPDSGLVLPGSTRLYKTELSSVANPWLPGRYNVTIGYRPDDVNQLKTVSYSFFYLSLPCVIIVLAPLVGIGFFVWSRMRAKKPKKITVKVL